MSDWMWKLIGVVVYQPEQQHSGQFGIGSKITLALIWFIVCILKCSAGCNNNKVSALSTEVLQSHLIPVAAIIAVSMPHVNVSHENNVTVLDVDVIGR